MAKQPGVRVTPLPSMIRVDATNRMDFVYDDISEALGEELREALGLPPPPPPPPLLLACAVATNAVTVCSGEGVALGCEERVAEADGEAHLEGAAEAEALELAAALCVRLLR